MAEDGPQADDVARWLIDNPDKEGTPDYVKMASAYKSLRQPAAEPASRTSQSWGSLWNDVKAAAGGDSDPRSGGERLASWWRGDAEPLPTPTPEAPNIPHIDDIMAAKRLTSDPNSFENVTGRALTGAMTGIPDTGIALYNAGARFIGNPDSQAAYLGPQMRENAGMAEMPADAPWWQALGEGGLAAFLGGGAGAAGSILNNARTTANVATRALPATATPAARQAAAMSVPGTAARMAAPTVLPTVGGYYGGEAGGWAGEKFLGDRETGALLGSLIFGTGAAVAPTVRSIIHEKYAGKGNPEAREIFNTANRQGVTSTAGMLGNEVIQRREQQLSGLPGGADVVQRARDVARAQIGDAYNQSAEARGSLDMTPQQSTIGTRVSQAASESAENLRAASDARQQALMDRVGADTPVPVGPILDRGFDMMTDPNARLTPSQRRNIDTRLTEQLMPLVTRNAAGDPIQPGIAGVGHNGGPPMPPPPSAGSAPYGYVAGFRTELGQDINTPSGQRSSPVAELYPPTTESMRVTAQGQGVPPQDFNNIQAQTRAVERTTPVEPGGPPGDYPLLQRYVKENPQRAYEAVDQRQNPNAPGYLEATGHPALGQIFGDIMRLIGNETINHPQTPARGPANFANNLMKMDPDYRSTVLGDQLGNVSDQVVLANALNLSTNQNGLTRAVGGQTDAAMNKVLGSEAAGQFGKWLTGSEVGGVIGRLLGVFGPSGWRGMRAGIMEGPTARNAMAGGPAPGGINQLAAALAAIQAEQQQQRAPLRITVP